MWNVTDGAGHCALVHAGGIAEMFVCERDREVAVVRNRRGFVRAAVEAGVPLLPVYYFGNSQLLSFGPRCCSTAPAVPSPAYTRLSPPACRTLPCHMQPPSSATLLEIHQGSGPHRTRIVNSSRSDAVSGGRCSVEPLCVQLQWISLQRAREFVSTSVDC